MGRIIPFDDHNYAFSERAHRLARKTYYRDLVKVLAARDGYGPAEVEWEDTGGTLTDFEDGVDRILHVWAADGTEKVYTVQERFRRPHYASFRELTVTGSNLHKDPRVAKADFEKLKADLYVYGYVTEEFDGWEEAVVVEVPRLKRLWKTGAIQPNRSVYQRKKQVIWGFPFDKLDQGGAIVLHQRRDGHVYTF